MKRYARFRIGQVLLAGVAAAALGMPAPLHAASWLDGPASQWNVPGMAVPKAPAAPTINPDCGKQEAKAAGQQQGQVAAAGWKLEQYWPAQALGALTAITALANYDGMCRPVAFNVFVFSGNTFAGTLSPEPMNSREDGVLLAPGASAAAGGGLAAAFIRYAPSDPLCCPSKGSTPVSYRLDTVGGSPVLLAVQIGSFAPAALPKAGGGGGGGHSWPWPAAAIPAMALAAVVFAIWAGKRCMSASGR
jgi:hypothetical protein